jgi:hypothetical protein
MLARGTTALLVLALWLAFAATARADTRTFLLADASAGIAVHASPGGRVTTQLPPTTPLGSPTWLWVLQRRGRWGEAGLPVRPNGTTGWIDLRGLRLVHTTTWVLADLARRSVTLMHGARPALTVPAAIGTSVSPTPTGRFFVTDLVATGDPSGPFGWYAFGLSGHQPNLPPGWGGGDQLAIHGTNAPSSIGTAASAGCLRVSSSALGALRARLRLGTPVVIAPNAARATQIVHALAARRHPHARPPRHSAAPVVWLRGSSRTGSARAGSRPPRGRSPAAPAADRARPASAPQPALSCLPPRPIRGSRAAHAPAPSSPRPIGRGPPAELGRGPPSRGQHMAA